MASKEEEEKMMTMMVTTNIGNDGHVDNDLGAAGGGGEDDAVPRGDAHQGDGTSSGHCSNILVLKSPHTTNLIRFILLLIPFQ